VEKTAKVFLSKQVRAISALWATLSMLAKALKRLVAIAIPRTT